MSLILEALKKSEAKRRLGEAPDLGTPFTLPRRRRNPLPLILLAIAILGALGWWFVRVPPATTAPKAETARTSGTANAVVATNLRERNASAETAATAGVPNGAARPAPAPEANLGNVRALPAAPSAPANAPVAAFAASHPERTRELTRTPDTATAKPALAMPPAETATNPAAPVGPIMPATVAIATNPPPAPAPTPAAAMPTSIAIPTAPPAAATNAPNVANTANVANDTTPKSPAAPTSPPAPMYYELPLNLRKDLPAIMLSMHVYTNDPTQRFVVVNGERLSEGDALKDDLTLREIQPDGLIMEFRGQRFFYPRTGR